MTTTFTHNLAIKTPQDAEAAYLRGELSEDEFRKEFGYFGRTEITLEEALTAVGFLIQFPEDMIEKKYSPESTADVIEKLNEQTPAPEPTSTEAKKKADEEAKAKAEADAKHHEVKK